jgi:hypothetical protein
MPRSWAVDCQKSVIARSRFLPRFTPEDAPRRRYRGIMRKATFLGALLSSAACTSLGPMPSSTGVAPLPAGRTAVEVQVGTMPGHYLSSGVTDDPRGSSIPQLLALFEPDAVLDVPGLFVAGRVAGTDEAGVIAEPMIGYRHAFDDRFAGGALLYGTHASHEDRGASYAATRVGLEIGVDVRLTPRSKWLELHATVGAAATGLSAEGTYCLDDAGRFGVDCPEQVTADDLIEVDASGVYPTGQLGLVLDIARHRDSAFHGARLGLMGAVGTMPTAVSGRQGDAEAFASIGLALTVGVGSAGR